MLRSIFFIALLSLSAPSLLLAQAQHSGCGAPSCQTACDGMYPMGANCPTKCVECCGGIGCNRSCSSDALSSIVTDNVPADHACVIEGSANKEGMLASPNPRLTITESIKGSCKTLSGMSNPANGNLLAPGATFPAGGAGVGVNKNCTTVRFQFSCQAPANTSISVQYFANDRVTLSTDICCCALSDPKLAECLYRCEKGGRTKPGVIVDSKSR